MVTLNDKPIFGESSQITIGDLVCDIPSVLDVCVIETEAIGNLRGLDGVNENYTPEIQEQLAINTNVAAISTSPVRLSRQARRRRNKALRKMLIANECVESAHDVSHITTPVIRQKTYGKKSRKKELVVINLLEIEPALPQIEAVAPSKKKRNRRRLSRRSRRNRVVRDNTEYYRHIESNVIHWFNRSEGSSGSCSFDHPISVVSGTFRDGTETPESAGWPILPKPYCTDIISYDPPQPSEPSEPSDGSDVGSVRSDDDDHVDYPRENIMLRDVYNVEPSLTWSAWWAEKRYNIYTNSFVSAVCCIDTNSLKEAREYHLRRDEVRNCMIVLNGSYTHDTCVDQCVADIYAATGYDMTTCKGKKEAETVELLLERFQNHQYLARRAKNIPKFSAAMAVWLQSRHTLLPKNDANVLLIKNAYFLKCRKSNIRNVDAVSHFDTTMDAYFNEHCLNSVSTFRDRAPQWLLRERRCSAFVSATYY